MDTEGASFRDNVHASIMPRRPIIKRRHVFFVLEAAAQGGPGTVPLSDSAARSARTSGLGAPRARQPFPSRPAISRVRP